jgi:hypothetical protein
MGIITRRALAALATLLVGASVLAAGALPAQAAPAPGPMLIGIRTGVHPTFDRIVLDYTGGRPGVSHRFVDELIRDGSGEVEWLTGCAFAEVVMNLAYAHDSDGNSSLPQPHKFRTRNLTNVMAVSLTGDYEGYVTLGIGMRRQTWVKVFTLSGPDRVVIDVGR